jgi:carbon starvation protein CstA
MSRDDDLVRPRLERGERVRGVGGSLLVESTVAIVVLLAAAVLVNGAPPPVDVPEQGAAPAAGP